MGGSEEYGETYAAEGILLVDADVVRMFCCKVCTFGSQVAERLVSDFSQTLCAGGGAGDEENISMVKKKLEWEYNMKLALPTRERCFQGRNVQGDGEDSDGYEGHGDGDGDRLTECWY